MARSSRTGSRATYAKKGIVISTFKQEFDAADAPRKTRTDVGGRGRRGLALWALVLGVLALALVPSVSEAQWPKPLNLELIPAEHSIVASWGVSSTAGLTGFRVRWKEVNGTGGGRVELARGARAYAILQLRHHRYEVRVRALYNEKAAGLAADYSRPLTMAEEAKVEEEEQEEPPEEGTEEPPEEEPTEEEPTEEEPTEEESPGGGSDRAAIVSGTPTGPPTPAGGWSVAYADAFGAPLGKGPGEDNTLFPNNCSVMTNCAGFNSNEMEVFNPSAVVRTSEGVKLTCTYRSTAQSPGSKHYVCGTLKGLGNGASGYRFFYWSPGKGQKLVFEAVAKFPPNTGEADPGWWSNGPPWNETEFDFFEGGGWGSQHTTGWRTDPLYTAWFASPHPEAVKRGFSEDPSLAYHTYTTEILPNNTYSEWIDGVPQPWATNVGPAKPIISAKKGLILSYALRTCSGCSTGFKSGTREFDIKSIAVYEDKAHEGVGIENGGLAPGTAIG